MDFESVKTWLTRWTERQARLYRWKGIIGLVLLPLALTIALTGIYWLLRLATRPRPYTLGDAKTCFWITMAILPCLFIANRFIARRDLMEERMREGPEDSFSGRYIQRRLTILLFFLWIVFTGPRLLDWVIDSFRQMRRVKQMDVHSCAAILWLLLSKGKKVSFDDMQREYDWIALDTVVPELRLIDGVVPLQNPPPGLSLTQDLRDEMKTTLHAG